MKEINKEEFKKEIEDYVKVLFRKTIKEADQQQLFQAVSYAVKDFIVDGNAQDIRREGCQDCIIFVYGIFDGTCSWQYDH